MRAQSLCYTLFPPPQNDFHHFVSAWCFVKVETPAGDVFVFVCLHVLVCTCVCVCEEGAMRFSIFLATMSFLF